MENSFSSLQTHIDINENIVCDNLINLKQLIFEVTDTCNLRCKYCSYSELYEGDYIRIEIFWPVKIQQFAGN